MNTPLYFSVLLLIFLVYLPIVNTFQDSTHQNKTNIFLAIDAAQKEMLFKITDEITRITTLADEEKIHALCALIEKITTYQLPITIKIYQEIKAIFNQSEQERIQKTTERARRITQALRMLDSLPKINAIHKPLSIETEADSYTQ